jgi:dephospho-CoA kinase
MPHLAPIEGERTLLDFKPAMRSIIARSVGVLLWSLILLLLAIFAAPLLSLHVYPTIWWNNALVLLALFIAAWKLARETLLWWSRSYRLTTARILAKSGILHTTLVEIPLRNVQQIVVDKTALERFFLLGTLLVTSAGSQTIDLAWVAIARPRERLARVRKAIDEAAPMPDWLAPQSQARRVMVIGLAGGVGSGKSTIASILGELGFLVIDSDQLARTALDRPEIRATLITWWGPGVINAEGKIDRAKVASIVFHKPEERARLEALVHPLVKHGREQVVERASAEGRIGVVVDAPLLFEAGSDKDVDRVLFVDTPREIRLARVKQTRNWDEAELARREAAQWPLDKKRNLAHAVVRNDIALNTPEDKERLRQRVEEAVETLRGSLNTAPAKAD